MKVIKPGREDMNWPRQITVQCCGAVLEIDPDDIRTDRDYMGDLNGYYVVCESCGGSPTIDRTVKHDADRWKRQRVAGARD